MILRISVFLLILNSFSACTNADSEKQFMNYTDTQLTHDNSGHCLNSTQIFSPNGEWIVFDGRNDDTQIGSTSDISVVNVNTGEIRNIYKTINQTEWGPGVGAATFSPVEETVLFIHGIRNADQNNPYTFTRRTGVAVRLSKPQQPLFYDARDILPPFTTGALRGGTHAHTWSGDGKWISFTYNDYVLQKTAERNPDVEDLRTIGVMIAGKKVRVKPTDNLENNDGEMFAFLVVPVVSKPRPGSDEINKAFDECWIGTNGYIKTDGSRQTRAIAYQGNVVDENGNTKTEIFVADIPDNILSTAAEEDLRGTETERPRVPKGITHRRISFTPKGVSNAPRHWLRSSSDGSRIAFLAKDSNDLVQLFSVSPNNTKEAPQQLTHLEFSIQGPFNFSPDGSKLAYIADNSVFVTDLETGESNRLTPRVTDDRIPVGAVNWSPDGSTLAYNRYVKSGEEKYLQIFLLRKTNR